MDVTLHLDLPPWLIFPYLFALGAVLGSFLNVVILRTPSKYTLREQWQALHNQPSHCPRCKTGIKWYDNIPVFGWLKLGGRCRACRMWISPRYPIIEFLNGALFVVVYWLEVPTGMGAQLRQSCLFTDLGPWTYPGLGWMSPEFHLHVIYAYHMILIEALLVASVIDLDHRIIPEITTTPATVVGVLGALLLPRVPLLPVWFQSRTLDRDFGIMLPESWQVFLKTPGGNPDTELGPIWVPDWVNHYPYLHGVTASLAGGLMGYLLIKFVRAVGSSVLRREAMGEGDIYLMICIGVFLGWQATVITFFLAPIFGLLFSWAQRFMYRDDSIPYGPFLSLGALFTIIAWHTAFERTHRLFELGLLLVPMVLLMVILFVISLWIVQGVKWLLGIPLSPPEESLAIWRPGDQTHFFAGENVNPWQGRWRTPDWEGNAAARGQVHENRWRDGRQHPGGPPRRML